MSTRGKTEVYTLVKDTIKELFANEEFMNQMTKTISENIQQKLTSLQETVDKQTKKINELEQKIDGLKQQEKINNICIYGISETERNLSNKNLTAQIIKVVNEQAGLELRNDYVITSYRTGKQTNNENKPRPIILQLKNHDTKVWLLKNASKFKGTNIFLAEDLTKDRREILIAARTTFGNKNAWSFNGQIYFKRDGQIKKIRDIQEVETYKK